MALKKLKTLRLGGYQIDDDTLAIMAGIASLRSLTIDEAAVTNSGLERIAGLPLEEIVIFRCYGVTDDGFRQFGRIAALGQLSVRGIPLSGQRSGASAQRDKLAVLRLNETGVNDAALEHLRGLKNLTRLELRQTPITDAAVDVARHPDAAEGSGHRPNQDHRRRHEAARRRVAAVQDLAFTPSGHITVVERAEEGRGFSESSSVAAVDGRLNRVVKAFASSQAEGLFALATERLERPWRPPWPIGGILPPGI